ncbi:hypothetical protein P3S68_015320 [Capsicum galapagoense]
MAPKKKQKQSNNAAESSSKSAVTEKETPRALKVKRKLIKKISQINSAQTKEAEISSQMQTGEKEKAAKKGDQGNHVGGKDARGNSMAPKKKPKQNNNAAESSSRSAVTEKETPQALKGKRKLVKKVSSINSAQTKEAEISSQMQAGEKEKAAEKSDQGNHVVGKDASTSEKIDQGIKETDTRGRSGETSKDEKTEKSVDLNEGREEIKKDSKTLNSLGGVIFMCNARTKEDCFRYRVMGVSASRQEFVMGIKAGLKIFLYDFDLKLMYGIYEASSAGGMKLQPAAFGGAFPAQVPFKIHKDCIPLPENVFKKAIKENYDEKTRKFKTELTAMQVEKLTELFRPAPWLDSTLKPVLRDPLVQPVIQQSIAPPLSGYEPIREHAYGAQFGSSKAGRNFSPLDHGRQQFSPHHVMPREVAHNPHFLTEKDYRSYGLQQATHLKPSTDYGSEQGMQQLRRAPAGVRSDATFARNEHVRSDARFPNEWEYRNQGLQSFHGQPVTIAPALESRNTVAAAANHSLITKVDPYDETTNSLVNRYLSLPRTMITPRELPSTGRESFASASNSASDIRLPAENVRYYPPMLAPHALSGHGHLHQRPGNEPGRSSSSVLPQYPFSGPPASRR